MPSVYLENGEHFGVMGDVAVAQEHEAWTVSVTGEIVSVSTSHLIEKLPRLSATSVSADALSGQIFLYDRDGKHSHAVEYAQIPANTHVLWYLPKDAAALIK